ncbi:hypothetical protein [Halorussus pelagicus]|uniref:hypothetical protein n=1 Tax=Halorussus pelagicus TaxID=2505977 RepID=UPI000FFB2125|nr:hypothetical protein [Halorussus pelagicus]
MTSGNSLASDPPDSLALSDLPDGTLVRSRVESDPTAPLSAALDGEVTGYAVFEPQDALLLDADGAGVVAFEDGVPRFAYHTGTGRGGPAALADLVVPGPYDVALRETDAKVLREFAAVERADLRVSPGVVADRLAGNSDLAERVRAAAPPEGHSSGAAAETPDEQSASDDASAVEAFLDDEEKIAAIRDRAREEAKERAEEWGLDGELQ